MNALLPCLANPASTQVTISQLAESARNYVQHAKAASTIKAYDADWLNFQAFCRSQALPSLPASPETVALYLTALADKGIRPATMSRRLAAISKMHSAAGFDSPTSMRHAAVKEVWAGIKRMKGSAQARKAAITTAHLRHMLDLLPDSLIGIRDRAMLLIGFTGALRRSELVALRVEDVEFVFEGLVLTIRRSKTDQEGQGEKIAIHSGRALATCPIRSLRSWLEASNISTGPIFRGINRHGKISSSAISDQAVALQVKQYALAVGLNPEVFSGHSLRAGLATSAAIAGASERRIQDQTRHRSVTMVRRYIRDGNLFRDNVTAVLGL